MAEYINFQEMALQCAPRVHVQTMEVLVHHESGHNPYAIGVNSSSFRLKRQPKTKAEAIKKAKWLVAHGYNFDAGFGQINIKNMKSLGFTIPDLFDPCKNLQGSAKILINCYERATMIYKDEAQIINAALSCYNTGNFKKGLINGYVNKVKKKVPVISDKEAVLLDKKSYRPANVIVPNLVSTVRYEQAQAKRLANSKNKKKLANKTTKQAKS